MNTSNIILHERKKHTIVLYHGTSTVFLHSIFKNGLLPNPPKKSFGSEEQVGFAEISYHGVYLTGSVWYARTASRSARDQHGGDPMIVTVQYVKGSGSADEDDVLEAIYSSILYYKKTIFDNVDKVVQEIANYLQSNDDALAMTRRSIQLLKNVLNVALELIFYDDDYETNRNLRLMGQHKAVFLNNDPDFRDALLEFMNSLKVFKKDPDYTLKPYVKDRWVLGDSPLPPAKSNLSVRITRPVGFSGKTRIIDIRNIKTGEIYYTVGGIDDDIYDLR